MGSKLDEFMERKRIHQRLLNKNMICGSGSDLATDCWKLGGFHRGIIPYVPYFLHLLCITTAVRWLSDLWTKLVFAAASLEGGHLTGTSLPGSSFTKAEVFAEARPLLLLFIPLFVHLKWHLYMEPVRTLLI